jgi:hypothetical protein
VSESRWFRDGPSIALRFAFCYLFSTVTTHASDFYYDAPATVRSSWRCLGSGSLYRRHRHRPVRWCWARSPCYR